MCVCTQTSDSLELRARVRGVLVDLFFIYASTNHTDGGSWVGGIDVDNGNKYRYVRVAHTYVYTVGVPVFSEQVARRVIWKMAILASECWTPNNSPWRVIWKMRTYYKVAKGHRICDQRQKLGL